MVIACKNVLLNTVGEIFFQTSSQERVHSYGFTQQLSICKNWQESKHFGEAKRKTSTSLFQNKTQPLDMDSCFVQYFNSPALKWELQLFDNIESHLLCLILQAPKFPQLKRGFATSATLESQRITSDF